MTIHPPLCITPSLMPGFSIGDAHVSITYSKRPGRDGRFRYRYEIVLPDGTEHSDDDLQSGGGGGSLNEGLESLCSFLTAAAESLAHCTRNRREPDEDDNASLFPRPVTEWAAQNSDELSMLQCELQEHVLIEE